MECFLNGTWIRAIQFRKLKVLNSRLLEQIKFKREKINMRRLEQQRKS
jgi:hypothetical protein